MHRTLLAALLALVVSGPALAAPVVVWLDSTPPDDKLVRKVDGQVGPSEHLYAADLSFPPQPLSEQDEKDIRALRSAVVDARARWNDFDVELEIATALEEALAAVDVIRDDHDLREIVDARLVQGAAVSRAFSERSFQLDDAAEPYRMMVPGAKVNLPWLDAVALDPERSVVAADLVDGSAYTAFSELDGRVESLPTGYLDLSSFPRDVEVFLDGAALGPAERQKEVVPGHHYLHIVRDGAVCGRQVLLVEGGLSTEVPAPVAASEVERARSSMLFGSIDGFPDDVKEALTAIGSRPDVQLYVAVRKDGDAEVEPWGDVVSDGPEPPKVKSRVVTVLGTGELGGGVVMTRLFDQAGTDPITAPAVFGSLGVEIGIYNAAIIGGMDLAFTPSRTVAYVDGTGDANVHTSVLPQPWGGLGGYVLRPDRTQATLLGAVTYGWNGPAHTGLGGRLVLGVPVDEDGTWFRLIVGGSTASKSIWESKELAGYESSETPMHVLFLRVGFGTRF